MFNSLPLWRIIRYNEGMTMTLAPKLATQLSLTEIASANIRALCGRAGWNISDLASALNQNRTAIGYRWNNRTDWRLEEIEQVAALFGTTPWDLITPAFGDEWVPDTRKLPRLDSNQQPADYWLRLMAGLLVLLILARGCLQWRHEK